MHGIPQEYLADYISAWNGKLPGVTLSWLEIEICRLAMQPQSISEIIGIITESYAVAKELTKSSAYRIIDNLIENNYLVASKEGRNRIIKTKSKGAIELGRLGRYFYEIQSKNMAIEFWSDVLNKITPYIGCVLESKVSFIGPEYQFAPIIIQECTKCSHFRGFSEEKQSRLIKNNSDRYFLRIAGALIREKDESTTIIETEIDDWPLKKDYVNLVIEVGAIGSFNENSILEEMIRILAPGGWLVLLEFTKSTPSLIIRMMKEITTMNSLFDEHFAWNSDFEIPKSEDLENKISEDSSFDKVIKISDSITSLILARKAVE